VDDAFADECDKAVDHLPEHFNGLRFLDIGVHLHVFFQIAVAELEDHVVVVRALHHLVHPDDVGRPHHL